MSWTWVRPADPSVLDGRPLLDLGTGDGQTLTALIGPRRHGVVGLDRNLATLAIGARGARFPLVCAKAARLPLLTERFAVVVAGDLFHHLDDDELDTVLAEVERVLLRSGTLVAWWYERHGRPAPDAPRFPRSYDEVARRAAARGFSDVTELDLEATLEPSPATAGIVAKR